MFWQQIAVISGGDGGQVRSVDEVVVVMAVALMQMRGWRARALVQARDAPAGASQLAAWALTADEGALGSPSTPQETLKAGGFLRWQRGPLRLRVTMGTMASNAMLWLLAGHSSGNYWAC